MFNAMRMKYVQILPGYYERGRPKKLDDRQGVKQNVSSTFKHSLKSSILHYRIQISLAVIRNTQE